MLKKKLNKQPCVVIDKELDEFVLDQDGISTSPIRTKAIKETLDFKLEDEYERS